MPTRASAGSATGPVIVFPGGEDDIFGWNAGEHIGRVVGADIIRRDGGPRVMGVRLSAAIRARLGSGASKVVVIATGSVEEQLVAVRALRRAGLREQVTLCSYLAADHPPLPASVAELLEDVVVPMTEFGHELFVRLAGERVHALVGPPVTPVQSPMPTPGRSIGFFGRPSPSTRADFAIYAFQAYRGGHFFRCRTCRAFSLDHFDPTRGRYQPSDSCPACGGVDLGRPDAPAADLILHVGPGGVHDSLSALVRFLGIDDRVSFRTDRARCVDVASCVVIVAPHTGVEHDPVIEVANQIGVPLVATNAGGVGAAAACGWLVPPAAWLGSPDRHSGYAYVALRGLVEAIAEAIRSGRSRPAAPPIEDFDQRWIDIVHETSRTSA